MDTDPRAQSRIPHARLVELIAGLSARDRAMLQLLDDYHFASGSQLQRLFFTDGTTDAMTRARNRSLALLVQARFVYRAARHDIPGKPTKEHVYGLAHPGQRVMNELRKYERPYRSITKTTAHYQHALAVTELYVRLKEAEHAGHILELVTAQAEPACHRRLIGSRQLLRPDAYLLFRVIRSGQRGKAAWFVEIERSAENEASTLDKLAKYRAYADQLGPTDIMPQVLFVALKPGRRTYLQRLLAEYADFERNLFTVVDYANAIPTMITGVSHE